MKMFINDWNQDSAEYVKLTPIEDNREYAVDQWLTDEDGNKLYLVSAYLYDDFVMFVYVFENEIQLQPDTLEDYMCSRQRIMSSIFNYEIDDCKPVSARGSCIFPRIIQEDTEDELEAEYEYDYIYELFTKANRIPEYFKNKQIAFKKDNVSFGKQIEKISRLSIYPNVHKHNSFSVKKAFTVPFGSCDINISYSTKEGYESFILIKSLKLHNLLEDFDKNAEEYRKIYEESISTCPESGNEINVYNSFEELRKSYDKSILILTLLSPEEHRSFNFRNLTKEPRNPNFEDSHVSTVYLFRSDRSKARDDGLFEHIVSLGEWNSPTIAKYEVVLESVTDNFQIEKTLLLEKCF